MIDTSKMRPTVDGQYLLPSLTYGWNDELISTLNARKVTPKTLDQYFKSWNVNVSKHDKNRLKNTASGRELIKNLLTNRGAKILGIGKTTEKAVKNATQTLHSEFNHLMPGQCANFPAYKWTYLQPDYLVLEQITLPDNSNICLILQRG